MFTSQFVPSVALIALFYNMCEASDVITSYNDFLDWVNRLSTDPVTDRAVAYVSTN